MAILERLTRFMAQRTAARLRVMSPLRADQPSTSTNMALMPMVPTQRQKDFLALTCREALYGGAAGGGKSEALLMWLAEGIHAKTYSGVIFRRTFKQLSKSNDSLIAKARRLYPALGGLWNGTEKQWRFPSGAMIEMGALEHETSVLNYQGPAYHRIAFDELTQFSRDQYEFLVNSRMRKVKDFPVSLGARGASNPGGPGHLWVKDRFVTKEAIACLAELDPTKPSPPGLVFEADRGRMFVPARIADNPYLDIEEYRASLSEFSDPVMRERMMNGDWSILPDSIIKSNWLRYYFERGQILVLENQAGEPFIHCDERECERFATIDTAGTSEERSRESRGKPHSWSVMAVWDLLPRKYGRKLILRHVWRKRVDFPDLIAGIEAVYREWQPRKVLIEAIEHNLGSVAYQTLRGRMPISAVSPGGKDKVARATDLLNMLERGDVFLPKYDNAWRGTLEAEWLAWQGTKDETADQIDVASYAAMHIGKTSVGTWGGPIATQGGPKW
jgi:phage terminase large subunit-like protein